MSAKMQRRTTYPYWI